MGTQLLLRLRCLRFIIIIVRKKLLLVLTALALLVFIGGAITLAHLDTAPNEGAWAHLVSDSPAAAIGCHPSATPFVADNGASFAKGAVADLVWFPDAKRLSELFSRPEVAERIVLRRGRVQDSRLPSYDEIEDLMSPPTKLKSVGSVVDRGATTAPKKAKAKGFTLSDSTDQHFGKDSDDSD